MSKARADRDICSAGRDKAELSAKRLVRFQAPRVSRGCLR